MSPSANDAQKLVQEYGKMRSREKCIEIYIKWKWNDSNVFKVRVCSGCIWLVQVGNIKFTTMTHTNTHYHTHKTWWKKMSSCIENMAFVPKYAHDNFCIVHKWFFLLIFLLSLVRFKQLQCRKVFDNNPIECVVHCKRSEPILFIMISIYILFHLYL